MSRDSGARQGDPSLLNRLALPEASSGRLYPWEFERHGDRLELEITGAVVLDDEGLLVDVAVAGLGVACGPVFAAADRLDAGALQEILSDWTQGEDRLALHYLGHRTVPPALRAFVHVARSGAGTA